MDLDYDHMALDEIRKTKIEKVNNLRKAGIDPYPAVSGRTYSVSDALEKFDELSDSKEEVVLAGRIMAKREHGGSVLLVVKDVLIISSFMGFVKSNFPCCFPNLFGII